MKIVVRSAAAIGIFLMNSSSGCWVSRAFRRPPIRSTGRYWQSPCPVVIFVGQKPDANARALLALASGEIAILLCHGAGKRVRQAIPPVTRRIGAETRQGTEAADANRSCFDKTGTSREPS